MRLDKMLSCEKWLHESCSIFSKTCIDCGRNICSNYLEKLRNLQTSKKKSLSEKEFRLLITILFYIYLLFCIAFYVGRL
jgi:uncharacterized membrane protein YvbJ